MQSLCRRHLPATRRESDPLAGDQRGGQQGRSFRDGFQVLSNGGGPPMSSLLSERLRPRTLADLTLTDHVVRRLEPMLEKRAPLNMVFRGAPGTGKTSAAMIFLDRWAKHRDHLEHFPPSMQHIRSCGSSWRIRPARRHREGMRCGSRGLRRSVRRPFAARL